MVYMKRHTIDIHLFAFTGNCHQSFFNVYSCHSMDGWYATNRVGLSRHFTHQVPRDLSGSHRPFLMTSSGQQNVVRNCEYQRDLGECMPNVVVSNVRGLTSISFNLHGIDAYISWSIGTSNVKSIAWHLFGVRPLSQPWRIIIAVFMVNYGVSNTTLLEILKFTA